MPHNVAIKVKSLTKSYRLYDSNLDRLKESLHPFRKKFHHEYLAINDVNLEIKKGESYGIIGMNGSGKSTLLKLISGVITPSSGSIEVNGTISALLELGSGFNPELTGIENIYFSGALQGYSHEAMDSVTDQILSFADIGDFAYQPVKIYSSGMFVRLAFAVAINVDPEILIIDEALSVGDSVFQQKCFRKLKYFQEKGKTILFVSHSLDSVLSHCEKGIVLSKGKKIIDSTAKEAVDVYKKMMVGCYGRDNIDSMSDANNYEIDDIVYKNAFDKNPNATQYGNNLAEIYDYGIAEQDGSISNKVEANSVFSIVMRIKFHANIENPIFAYVLKDLKGVTITGTNTLLKHIVTGNYKKGDCVTVKFKQKMNLLTGTYSLCLGCTGYDGNNLVVYDRLYDVLLFDVISIGQNAVGILDLLSDIELNRKLVA